LGSRMSKRSFGIGSAWATEKLDASTKTSTARVVEVKIAAYAILCEVVVWVVRFDDSLITKALSCSFCKAEIQSNFT
jgi:hypothetical protein